MAKDLNLVVMAPLLLERAGQVVQSLAVGVEYEHGFALAPELLGQGP